MGYRLLSRNSNGKNKYKITIELGQDILGKRKRKTEIFEGTKIEVEKREAELKSEYYHIGKQIKVEMSDLTFEQMSDYYIARCCRNIKPVTINKYKKLLGRINGIIGDKKIQKLTTIDLNEMYYKLEKSKTKGKVSGSTLYEYYKLINLILNTAVNFEKLDRNVNKLITKPKLNKHIQRFYDTEQVNKLIESLNKENIKWKTLINLTLETGCRRAEIASLKWDMVDFDSKYLYIKSSLKVVNGTVYEDDPKTEMSRREIPLSDRIIGLLKEYKEWQDYQIKYFGDSWKNENRVFPSRDGSNMHPDSITKIFDRILKKNNLPHISFHELRHTNCSYLISRGIDIKTVSERLGHTVSKFSLERYAHSYDDSKRASANAFEAFN